MSYLDTVVAGSNSSVLDLDVGWGMCELALGVRPGALVPLKLPADLQLQPAGIFAVEYAVHVDHCHSCVAAHCLIKTLLLGAVLAELV